MVRSAAPLRLGLCLALCGLVGCYDSHGALEAPDAGEACSSDAGSRCLIDRPCWCRLEHVEGEEPWARCFPCIEECGPAGEIDQPGHCELFY